MEGSPEVSGGLIRHVSCARSSLGNGTEQAVCVSSCGGWAVWLPADPGIPARYYIPESGCLLAAGSWVGNSSGIEKNLFARCE